MRAGRQIPALPAIPETRSSELREVAGDAPEGDMAAVAASDRRLLVGGEWVETGQLIDVRSPYSGEVIARVPEAGTALVQRALTAATDAMREALLPYARAEILERISILLREKREDFAHLISLEAGKPLKAARIEADRAATTFSVAATEARKLVGEVVPMEATAAGKGKIGFTIRVPVGVVGAITPFNFPLNLVAHKVAPALAAGCSVVLKPARQTPLSALALAEVVQEAGLPDGWLNVVVGPAADIGDVLLNDPRVGLISFTGSSEIGWQLRARAPQKRVVLELGNSSPALVEPDADLALAADKLAPASFFYSGQTCISVQRIYVRDNVHAEFEELFLDRVRSLSVGDPSLEATDVGPVIDQSSRERILDWIEEARRGGAEVLHGGRSDGTVIEPTVLSGVTAEMSVCAKEVFGPVVSIIPYRSLSEGIELCNGTPYGLQAGIFTRDISSAFQTASRLEFGGVLINEAPSFRADQMPYGGVKASGNTKEGPAWAMREMTEERLIVVDF